MSLNLIYILLSVLWSCTHKHTFNTLRPGQNSLHFADDIFKRIFMHENVWTLRKISLNCVPKVPINNILALVQIMAWRRPGNKPLSEPIMVRSLMNLCITRPQWVNDAILTLFKVLPPFMYAIVIKYISHLHGLSYLNNTSYLRQCHDTYHDNRLVTIPCLVYYADTVYFKKVEPVYW